MTSNIGDDDFSEALYTSVQGYLKGTGNGSKRCARAIPGLVKEIEAHPSGLRLSLAIDAALRTVHSAIADFKEAWNNDSSAIMTLPNELLIECFEPLSFQGRVAASQVSRAWRATILGNRAFWATIDIPYWLCGDRAVSRLRNMIVRSEPALLVVHWSIPIDIMGRGHPQLRAMVLQLLRDSIARMRSLEIYDTDFQDTLCYHPALSLESLAIVGLSIGWLPVPALWILDSAPNLRYLSMPSFALPDQFTPLRNIATFTGHIYAPIGTSHSWGTRLFDLFPCLVRLTLHNIRNPMDLPHFVVPSLRYIHLHTDQPLDFSPLFHTWTTPPADDRRRMEIRVCGPHALSAALQHVVAVQPESSPNISLALDSQESISLSTSAPYHLEIALTWTFQRWSDYSGALRECAHLGMVQSLHLSQSMLIAVLRADVEFPAVEKLSVKDDRRLAASAIEMALRRSSVPPLRVPRLKDLVFDFSALAPQADISHTVLRLADFIRDRVRTATGTLASVTIVGRQEHPDCERGWDDSDVSELFAFAPAVYHRLSPTSSPRVVERTAGKGVRMEQAPLTATLDSHSRRRAC